MKSKINKKKKSRVQINEMKATEKKNNEISIFFMNIRYKNPNEGTQQSLRTTYHNQVALISEMECQFNVEIHQLN
jgi:hypothetical protein